MSCEDLLLSKESHLQILHSCSLPQNGTNFPNGYPSTIQYSALVAPVSRRHVAALLARRSLSKTSAIFDVRPWCRKSALLHDLHFIFPGRLSVNLAPCVVLSHRLCEHATCSASPRGLICCVEHTLFSLPLDVVPLCHASVQKET